jgi:hypothetical protein
MSTETQWSRIRGAVIAGALIVMTVGSAISAAGPEHSRARSLEGTWRVKVTLYDCSSGVERPPFWSLLSFARGGTLTETTANQALPGQRTPGHGVWGRTGGRDFQAVSEAFILFGPTYRSWTQRITQEITMASKDEFTSEASVAFLLTAGSLPSGPVPLPPAGCARAVGYRF